MLSLIKFYYPILTISFFITLFVSCKQTKTEYYQNGQKMHEFSMKNGQKEGTEKRWYNTGRIQSEFNYKNNKLNGKSSRWFHNGNLESVDYYTNDLLNGISEIWDESGIKIIEKEYRNDTLNGIYKEWHNNGQRKTEGQYKNGFFDGKWVYYSASGIVVGNALFEMGTGVLTGFNLTGKRIREVNYFKNQKHGEEKHFNDLESLEKIVVYNMDKILEVKYYE